MSKGPYSKVHDICKKELATFIKKFPVDTSYFMAPVDPVALGIPQYKEIIKYPMDLGTIQARLSRYNFAHFDEFASDVTLVFANAILFNPPDHPVHQSASKLKAAFPGVYYKLAEKPEVANWAYPKVPPSRGAHPPLSGEELQQCKQVMSTVMRMEDSAPFRDPVPWFQEDLAHYPREVGRLMDLSTVVAWLNQGAYGTPEQMATDIRQVFRNGTKFNQEGSVFYQQARTCEVAFEKAFKAGFSGGHSAPSAPAGGMGMDVDTGGDVPSEEIGGLAAKVNKLSSNDLIRLVDEVRAKYSSILSQPADDELELDFDLLDKPSFDGLSLFINSL
eukprot:TRINITY_DN13878_c0_g1_i2.p1 TRINITY_DN13878_c0_g1~~TRINITY_DN13878_c0_g1_i2.p1  ORF type:complete len:332 (+),score=73.68 TRINITY_DN13878_c0_g1_i2:327-1322(+)